MTALEARKKLQACSSEKINNGWTYLDTGGNETYGLNLTRLREIADEIERDPFLADELYACANHDLKVLAALIDDPESYTQDELDKRSEQLYPSPFAKTFCHRVLAKSPFAVHFIDKWSHCMDNDFICYAYHTLAEIAGHNNNLSDEFYADHLKLIANNIHQSPDLVKEAMYTAMLSIGSRDEKLRKKSMEAAERIGNVEFNDGRKVYPLGNLEKKARSKRFSRVG